MISMGHGASRLTPPFLGITADWNAVSFLFRVSYLIHFIGVMLV